MAYHQGVRHQRDPITPTPPGSDIIDSHAGAAWEVVPQGLVFPRGPHRGKREPRRIQSNPPVVRDALSVARVGVNLLADDA